MNAGTPSLSTPATITKLKQAVKTRQNCSVANGSLGSNGTTDPDIGSTTVTVAFSVADFAVAGGS